MDGATEFVVEHILRHRRRGRGLQYLVAWQGYDVADATWEPESHLCHAPAKVAEYWAALDSCAGAWGSAPEDASELASSESESLSDTSPFVLRRALPPCQDA